LVDQVTSLTVGPHLGQVKALSIFDFIFILPSTGFEPEFPYARYWPQRETRLVRKGTRLKTLLVVMVSYHRSLLDDEGNNLHYCWCSAGCCFCNHHH
jgi:hypothetical protein